MAPKIVDREHRKQEIALAALEVFARRGLAQTSMSHVAEAAGISKGAIYLYFDSKEDLTVAAVGAWVAAVREGVRPMLEAGGDPLSRLRLLLQASTRAFLENPQVLHLFLGILEFALREPARLARLDLVRRVSAPIRDAICGILREGAAEGILRPQAAEEAPRIAINVVAFVDGLGLHHVASPGFFDLAGQLDLYLEGLVHSLRADPDPGRKGESLHG
ncbi:TetR/AcrR family transcriptional regulator [Myxococcota bacterium]|nr:TetR/AcrR family transcriptional regulator [Myxococcota bacterium]MBU1410957.1 TetR/AcrR family transcriptional regulator [Myxococcota bacterium]